MVETVLVDAVFPGENALPRFYSVRLRTGYLLDIITRIKEVLIRAICHIIAALRCVHGESIEEGVLESSRSLYSLLGVECHHFEHQVYCMLGGIGDERLEGCRHKLGEGETNLGGQQVSLRPLSLRGTAQDSASLIYLVCLIIPWEQGP